jgi:hypothetical protein
VCVERFAHTHMHTRAHTHTIAHNSAPFACAALSVLANSTLRRRTPGFPVPMSLLCVWNASFLGHTRTRTRTHEHTCTHTRTHTHAHTAQDNLPVLMGLLCVWNASFLGHATAAVLPYCQALAKLAPHIQQASVRACACVCVHVCVCVRICVRVCVPRDGSGASLLPGAGKAGAAHTAGAFRTPDGVLYRIFVCACVCASVLPGTGQAGRRTYSRRVW